MTREDEYTLTLSSGKIVMLISALLCVMLACFVTGLVIGRSPQLGVSVPSISSPDPEVTRADDALPKVSLPEVPKQSKPPQTIAAPKSIAKKEDPKPAPPPARAPSASASTEVYTICVLSAKNKAGAESYAESLREGGYKASVQRTQSKSGTTWYRTVIGEFPARDGAERQLAELRKKGEFADAFLITK